jgi:hypothetical protein
LFFYKGNGGFDMYKNITKLFSVVFIVFLISGCAGFNKKKDEKTDNTVARSVDAEDPYAAEKLKFDDIPIPEKFVINLKESFVFRNDYTRVGIVKYEGPGDINTITAFFKKQMPLFNWELINSIEYRKSIISFLKQSQSCVIIVEQLGAFGGSVTFTIASGPRNNG